MRECPHVLPLLGFALGFFLALQLGPMCLLLIRSTLRGGWVVGAAVGAGIETIDGLYAACGAAVAAPLKRAFLTATAIARRAMGERAMALADLLAGLGMLAFGGALAYATVQER